MLTQEINVSEKFEKNFNKNPLVKTVLLLKELDKTKYTKDFLKHLSFTRCRKGSEILAGKLAIKIGRYDYAIQIAKRSFL